MSGERVSAARELTSASLRIGAIELFVRPAVAVQERTFADGIGWYLSLYGDEIDARAETFWSSGRFSTSNIPGEDLELTDAAFLINAHNELVVARGAASTFPLYWRVDGQRLKLSTSLPISAGEPFSRAGLVAAVAGACLHSSYEINAFTETPLAHWRRVRRGAVTRFKGTRLHDEQVIRPPDPGPTLSCDAVANEVRSAFDAYSRSQRRVSSSVLEVSGGFDSTLAAAIASRAGMRGVSVAFPYYEFRFESAVQQATADFLGISRIEFDGTDLFPYTPSTVAARFDEPSVFVTGIRHSEKIARFAAQCAAERIYMGHGGDQCFATDLYAREGLVGNPPARGPFSNEAWRVVRRAIDSVRDSAWTDRSLGTILYDARQDVWVRETFGPIIRTPFSDLRVFRSALAWSRWCKARRVRPDKTILAQAASDLLPNAVLTRKGKVAYDGVWMRAYNQQAEQLAALFEQVGSVLAHIGVSTHWLQRRALELGAWKDTSDREVLALYAVAVWLSAWGVTRVTDLAWAD